jgi:NTP pyrophosphatase (non-canonical NTP hydrolase)
VAIESPAQSRLSGPGSEDHHGPRVVICGSFRRGLKGLRADFEALRQAGCDILSPIDVTFVAERDGFAFAAHEVGEDPNALEERHLEALRVADFVWLHCPEGYVGPSAALELGVAHSLGTPVYCRSKPADPILAGFAVPVEAPSVAVDCARESGNHTPAIPLRTLQSYYKRVALQRGYDRETAQDALLLLVEEVGELARAVRQSVGLARVGGYDGVDAAAELADVQLYVLHLANALGIDLAVAVSDKERKNAERHTRLAAA